MSASYVDDKCLGVDLGSRQVKVALVLNRELQEWRSFRTTAFYRLHSRPRGAVQADEIERRKEQGGDDLPPSPFSRPNDPAGAPVGGPSESPASPFGAIDEPSESTASPFGAFDEPESTPFGAAEIRPADRQGRDARGPPPTTTSSSPTSSIVVDFEALGFRGYDRVVSTGYGRNNLAVDGARVVSEVMAHAAGAAAQTRLSDFVNLDMGGQDFKLTLVEGGIVSDMAANPRCAASSGRFLENMADALDLGLDELGGYWQDPLPIDSTCSVFAETEVVGLLSQGYPVERIAAGVNLALVRKLAPLAGPLLERSDKVVFTGGCARSPAVRNLLEEELGREVLVPEHPEAMGAFGAALVR